MAENVSAGESSEHGATLSGWIVVASCVEKIRWLRRK